MGDSRSSVTSFQPCGRQLGLNFLKAQLTNQHQPTPAGPPLVSSRTPVPERAHNCPGTAMRERGCLPLGAPHPPSQAWSQPVCQHARRAAPAGACAGAHLALKRLVDGRPLGELLGQVLHHQLAQQVPAAKAAKCWVTYCTTRAAGTSGKAPWRRDAAVGELRSSGSGCGRLD